MNYRHDETKRHSIEVCEGAHDGTKLSLSGQGFVVDGDIGPVYVDGDFLAGRRRATTPNDTVNKTLNGTSV